MFSSFGQIEECRILRGPDGQSRGRFALSTGSVLSLTACRLQHSSSTYSHGVFIQAPPYFFTSTLSSPKSSAIHLQWHPFHPHSLILRHSYTQPPHLTVKGHLTRCPAQWSVALATIGCWCFVGSAGRRLGSVQLLLYRLLHHTQQRLELACRCISYIPLDCTQPQTAGSTRLSCWCVWLNLIAETIRHKIPLLFIFK